jgi:hypothetical protein
MYLLFTFPKSFFRLNLSALKTRGRYSIWGVLFAAGFSINCFGQPDTVAIRTCGHVRQWDGIAPCATLTEACRLTKKMSLDHGLYFDLCPLTRPYDIINERSKGVKPLRPRHQH